MKFTVVFLAYFVIILNARDLKDLERQLPGNLVPITKIPGTSLHTGLFYIVGMKSFPNCWVTWTEEVLQEGDGNYVQIDVNPKNSPFYKPGQKWENEIQWIFEPSEEEGFYTFRNKGIPNGRVTWRNENGTNYVIIDKTSQLSSGVNLENDAFFIKPIQAAEDEKMYQLQYKNLPEGTITWTWTKYGEYSHYIQVDATQDNKAKYIKNGGWYEDGLFEFTSTSDIKLEGSISQFELTDSASTVSTVEEQCAQLTTRSLVNNFIIENTSLNKTLKTIEETFETENDITLTFNEDLKAIKNLKVSLTIPSLTGSEINTEIHADFEMGATNSVEAKIIQNVTVISDIETQPKSTVEVSIVKDTLENIELPFRALMIVEGKADRMAADHSGFVKGPVPAEMIMPTLHEAGLKNETMREDQDSVLIWVTGTLKGSFVIGTGINFQIYFRYA